MVLSEKGKHCNPGCWLCNLNDYFQLDKGGFCHIGRVLFFLLRNPKVFMLFKGFITFGSAKKIQKMLNEDVPCSPLSAANEIRNRKILELEQKVTELENKLLLARRDDYDFMFFFEESGNGMVLFDKDQRVVDVNQALLSITGMRKQDFAGISVLDFINKLISPKNRTKIICVVTNMLRGNTIQPVEFEFKNKYLEISFYKGSPNENLIGIINDITTRKQVEIKLSESEINLRSLFNAMKEIVFEIDYNGRYLNIAPTAPGLMYLSPDSAIGKTLHDIFPKEQADLFLAFIQRCFDQRTTQTIEYQLEIDGKMYWFEGRASLKTESTVLFIANDITEKKEAEAALDVSEEKFRNFFEQSQDGIRLTNSQGVIIAWNRGMEEITGITSEQAVGSYTWDITFRMTPDHKKTPELYESTRQLVLQSLETGSIGWLSAKNEYELRRTDGTTRFVQISVFPVKTQSGLFFGSVIQDITDRKLYEVMLKNDRNLLQGLLDNLLIGVVVWDKNGDLVKANKTLFRLTGYEAEDIKNREKWLQLVYPDPAYREMVVNDWNTSAQSKDAIREFAIRCRDGSSKDIEFMVSFLEDGRAIVSMIDISERKRSEEALRRKDVLLEASARASQLLFDDRPLDAIVAQALETIGKAVERDRVYVFEFHEEPETGTMFMSQRYEWVRDGVSVQIDNPELQNVPVFDVAPRWFEILSKGQTLKGNIRDFPVSERTALEAQDIVSILVMPVVVNSKCWGFVGIDNCTSEDNWTEAESLILKSFTLTIGMAIIRRRSEIELKIAKEKAEEYNNLKTAFLQNMSHEIRTPMNGILGFTELLIDPDITSEMQHEYIQIIKSSGERMLSIINDLLDISLIESGQVEINKSTINLNNELLSLYRFFKPDAESKSIRFRLIIGSPEIENPLFTDREKLFAILTNLIKNAIKFTHQGSIEFGFSKKGNDYEFFVSDTGIGIAHDKLEMIFERFVQADLTISKPYEGAGLGLAIARAYVEILGGRIWVESQPGAGSQFYFTIPSAESQSIVLTEKEMLYKMTPGTSAVINVLIAEDTEHSDFYLTQVIKKYCKTIFHVKTGIQAVEVCKNNPAIDLILIDIKMPEMDGYQAVRLIRQFNQKVVIIAQTAYALTGDRENALDAGCNDYLAKPIKRETLLKTISRYFPLQ